MLVSDLAVHCLELVNAMIFFTLRFMVLRFKEAYSLAKVTILNKENNSVNVK